MSGGGIKHFFEQPAVEDSRVFAQIGRTFGWQGLTDEAKHNEQNPGRAITKAGEYALGSYLGGLLGAGGEAGVAGSTYPDAAAELAAGTSGLGGITASQLGQQALSDSLDTGLLGTASQVAAPQTTPTLLNSLPQGSMESALKDTGYTPSSLRYAFQNANAGNGTSLGQNLANFAGQKGTDAMNGALFNTFKSNATGSIGKQFALKTGMDLMSPHQGPQAAPMMRSQAPQGPMPSPYSNSFGPGGNSLGSGINNMSEAEKRYYRSLGYPV